MALWAIAAGPLMRYEAVEPCMGTLFRVTVYAESESASRTAIQAAFARARQLDTILSDYKPDSELNLLTRQPAGTAVLISGDLSRVLAASQEIARATDGAFDVTLGSVIQLWRKARRSGELPAEDARKQALQRTGWRHLNVDLRRNSARLDLPAMQLDLGGIAKGHAADEMLKIIVDRGIRRALIAAGGDLRIGAAPPGEKGWRVNLDWTNEHLVLANCAVSTSGDAEQWIEIGGERYSHIVDPKTGLGLKRSSPVTVIGPSGLVADPVATAVSVLPREAGANFARKMNCRLLRP